MGRIIEKKLQVFVSSTYSDLTQERQAAVGAILTAGHIPAGMELFTSGDESQLKVIYRWIDQSDIFLLILGGRYGSIEPKSGKSYVHLEYEYALNSGKPLITCVIDENALDVRVKEYGMGAIEREYPDKWKDFKKQVLTKIVKFWKNPIEIENMILAGLAKYAGDDNLAGWVRASHKSIASPDNENLSNPNIRLVAETRQELSKEFHGQKYGTRKFDLAAIAVKDCLQEIAEDRQKRMIKRILFDRVRVRIIFVHPYSGFLKQRAVEDNMNQDEVIKLQKQSVEYVVKFHQVLSAAYQREKKYGHIDPNNVGNVQIRLIEVNPYITIERFGNEINWGLYTSDTAGKNCAMFAVNDEECHEVFEQLKNHFKALLKAPGQDLLRLSLSQPPWLNHDLVNFILANEGIVEPS